MATASSNWKSLKQVIKPAGSASSKTNNTSDARPLKRKRLSAADDNLKTSQLPSTTESASLHTTDGTTRLGKGVEERPKSTDKKMVPVDEIMGDRQQEWQKDIGQYLAMDCEMVGVGPDATESTLARVSIVNYHGHCVLDRFVKPREKVTDYRTWVSGVREEDLLHAPSFAQVQREVAALIKDRILIGHALSNDTQVLLLSHPWTMIRDTSKYAPLQGIARTKRPGLKTLAKLCLGIDIQGGEHSSITDARATMAVYRTQKSAWESSLRTHSKPQLVTTSTVALQNLDLTNVNTNQFVSNRQQKKALMHATAGGAASGSMKGFGLAQTMRLARAAEQAERARDVDNVDANDDAVIHEKRKKRKTEDEDGLVVGFSFDEPVKRVDNVVETSKTSAVAAATNGKKKVGKKATVKGSGSRVAASDEKRLKSKASWWEEE
ncbi:hypothetical protein ACM66B_001031 [Microbotryomycetes sp. NB124-2]